MPWKNGGGTTTELFVEPAGAGLDAFVWRVSVAEVVASGAFSAFSGCDRIIVQTEGSPMTLAHGAHGAHALELLRPYAFDGEWATEGRLAGAMARDFNVIVRRSGGCARVDVVQGGGEARGAEEAAQVVHALRGVTSVVADGRTVVLAPGESVVVEGGAVRVRAADDGVAVIVLVTRHGR